MNIFDDFATNLLEGAALAAVIESESEGFTAEDAASAGPPPHLECDVFFLISDLPDHEQEWGLEIARDALARMWPDAVQAAARGWMFANMGAVSRVFTTGAEPVGRVP